MTTIEHGNRLGVVAPLTAPPCDMSQLLRELVLFTMHAG
jgi:hypothetical protein